MEEQLNDLKEQLNNTTDFLEVMEIQGMIEDIEIRLGQRLPPKPPDSPYLCEGCSA